MMNPFMQAAICEAEKAAQLGEVPVGAVLVQNNAILLRAHNRTENGGGILAHAELLLLQNALAAHGVKRLHGCSLYVTLEPCAMCAGAILHARPDRVYFGAYDAAAGACGGRHDLLNGTGIEVYGGIMEGECRVLLQNFFKSLR